MNLRPDYLFLQAVTLLYFCIWLWLGVSTGVIALRDFARRPMGIALGTAFIVCGLVWGYLFLVALRAQISLLDAPLLTNLLLLIMAAGAYFPLQPWRNDSATRGTPFVRRVRLVLVVSICALALIRLLDIVPMGDTIGLLLPSFLGYPLLFVMIGGLTLYTLATCEPKPNTYFLAILVLAIALVATYIFMLSTLIQSV